MASLEGEEQAVRALGPAADAAVQANLGPAVGSAVAAAVEGAARATATATATAAGGGAAGSPEALQRAMEAAMQPVVEQLKEVQNAVRSSEGRLVRAVQAASAELQAAVAAAGIQQYNATAAAHNIWALKQGGDARFMLLKDSGSKVPQGFTLFAKHFFGGPYIKHTQTVELNNSLAKLSRFYGIHSSSIATEYHKVCDELQSRRERLQLVLCTA